MAYQRKDAFYARAKHAGYRSRAAYKLLELARRYRLIRPGDHVVDLGAWPGGWLQVAAELTGPQGVVVGVDLRPIDAPAGAGDDHRRRRARCRRSRTRSAPAAAGGSTSSSPTWHRR